MPVMFASDFSGMQPLIVLWFTGLATALFALCGIVPALRPNRPAAEAMLMPAVALAALQLIYAIYLLLAPRAGTLSDRIDNFFLVAAFFAGPPLAAIGIILWVLRRREKYLTPASANRRRVTRFVRRSAFQSWLEKLRRR